MINYDNRDKDEVIRYLEAEVEALRRRLHFLQAQQEVFFLEQLDHPTVELPS
jgi:hypothetical protein